MTTSPVRSRGANRFLYVFNLSPSSNTPDSGDNGSLFGMTTWLQPNEMVVAALLHSPPGLVGASAFWNLPSATRSGSQVKPPTPQLPDRTAETGQWQAHARCGSQWVGRACVYSSAGCCWLLLLLGKCNVASTADGINTPAGLRVSFWTLYTDTLKLPSLPLRRNVAAVFLTVNCGLAWLADAS